LNNEKIIIKKPIIFKLDNFSGKNGNDIIDNTIGLKERRALASPKDKNFKPLKNDIIEIKKHMAALNNSIQSKAVGQMNFYCLLIIYSVKYF